MKSTPVIHPDAHSLRHLGSSYFPAWESSPLAELNIGQF
jgi:hypothetical protein